jgi:hypothetical protein
LSPSFDKLKLVGHQTDHSRLLERVQKGENAAFNRSEIHRQDLRFQSGSHFPSIHNPSSASGMPLQQGTDSKLLWRHNGCSTSIMDAFRDVN